MIKINRQTKTVEVEGLEELFCYKNNFELLDFFNEYPSKNNRRSKSLF